MAQIEKRLSTMWETRVRSLGWEDLLEKEMFPSFIVSPSICHEVMGWDAVILVF